jgi:hypothetical protein
MVLTAESAVDVDAAIDFDNASLFLEQARAAHQRGDHSTCLAARKLVAIALNLSEGPKPVFKTRHLMEK